MGLSCIVEIFLCCSTVVDVTAAMISCRLCCGNGHLVLFEKFFRLLSFSRQIGVASVFPSFSRRGGEICRRRKERACMRGEEPGSGEISQEAFGILAPALRRFKQAIRHFTAPSLRRIPTCRLPPPLICSSLSASTAYTPPVFHSIAIIH